MNLWSVIPIGVHHYTILSTMVSFLSLGNILWKDTTCKNSLEKESYIVISFHHLILQLSYTTQAWILKFKTCAMQAKHMKCTFKCINQVYELAPPTWVLNFELLPLLCHLSPYVKVLPLSLISLFLSPFVINDHKGSILDRLRLSMSINGVRIIFPNLVQSIILAKDI